MERKKTADEGYPIYLFFEGNNFEAQKFFGAHLLKRGGEEGVMFRLWAPHARAVSVVGDFNSWLPGSHPMEKVDEKGIWEVFVAGLKEYDVKAHPRTNLIIEVAPGIMGATDEIKHKEKSEVHPSIELQREKTERTGFDQMIDVFQTFFRLSQHRHYASIQFQWRQ